MLEALLAQGWRYDVEVVVDALVGEIGGWIPRHLGRLGVIDAEHTRLAGTTDEPYWYAEHLARIRARFRVAEPVELREAVRFLGRLLPDAAS